jgi:ATP synthase protein I
MESLNRKSGFSDTIEKIEERKLKEKGKKVNALFMGFSMFGLVGWSVAIPTLLATGLGVWLDKSHPQKFSWTLTLLITGLIVGCLMAAYWVRSEDGSMDDKETKNEH